MGALFSRCSHHFQLKLSSFFPPSLEHTSITAKGQAVLAAVLGRSELTKLWVWMLILMRQ